MIVDRCKPLTAGESDTVRIVMSAHEAAALLAELEQAQPPRHLSLFELQVALKRCSEVGA